jgi:hypothetical protein
MERCKEQTVKVIELLRINEAFPNNVSEQKYW